MNLDFAPKTTEIEDPITKKIRETIEFQKSYADELYRSNNWEDFDMGFIAWLEEALKIFKEHPPLVKEKIVYRDIPTKQILVKRIIQKRYVPIEWDIILQQMMNLCNENPDILNDEIIKTNFGIDMETIRKDLDHKEKNRNG